MTLFDQQQRLPERVMLVFGFVGIAAVAFAAGWLVGTTLELIMTMTQDEAEKRYCPFSMGHDKESCAGSGCMGWRWLPKQTDARIAKGFCGMVA
jgi:hypothetical protein